MGTPVSVVRRGVGRKEGSGRENTRRGGTKGRARPRACEISGVLAVARGARFQLVTQVPVDATGTIGTTTADGLSPSSDINGEAGSAISRIV